MGLVIPFAPNDAPDLGGDDIAEQVRVGNVLRVNFPRLKLVRQHHQATTQADMLVRESAQLCRQTLQVLRRATFLRDHYHDRLSSSFFQSTQDGASEWENIRVIPGKPSENKDPAA